MSNRPPWEDPQALVEAESRVRARRAATFRSWTFRVNLVALAVLLAAFVVATCHPQRANDGFSVDVHAGCGR